MTSSTLSPNSAGTAVSSVMRRVSCLAVLAGVLSYATPTSAAEPFAARLFTGSFKSEQASSFNPDYRIGIGDKIAVRIWGAMTFDSSVAVDAQGNIFLPQIGPVKVLSVTNSELNRVVSEAAARTFKAGVGVYAALDTAQPVKVFVTGMARVPGLYAGVSGDSVLRYLDKAGGVDPARGSYTRIKVLRRGAVRAHVNLYEFLGQGQLDALALVDGDTIVVEPKTASVEVSGEVLNENEFELSEPNQVLSQILKLAQLKPSATHVQVTRIENNQTRSDYVALDKMSSVELRDGDKVKVTSDATATTMLVRVEGAHTGTRALVLSVNATLGDVLKQLSLDERSNLSGLQLYRKSVAQRQAEAIKASLDALQAKVLNTASKTSEEAALRKVEAELALQFISRAKDVQPRGQVVLGTDLQGMLLEDGDVLRIPAKTSVVQVNGEVNLPNAMAWQAGKDANYYVEQAGGYLKGQSNARVLVIKPNGVVVPAETAAELAAGDEVLVLPEVSTKNIEVTRGITQILYQIAVAARVVVGLL